LSKLCQHHSWDNPPEWLTPGRSLDHTSVTNRKNYERSVVYYTQLLRVSNTTPGGWTDYTEIDKIYRECARRRAAGEDVVVDHIVPVKSDLVSGLQCHWNLQIVTAKYNNWKSNTFWPDGPMDAGIREQVELFA